MTDKTLDEMAEELAQVLIGEGFMERNCMSELAIKQALQAVADREREACADFHLDEADLHDDRGNIKKRDWHLGCAEAIRKRGEDE